MAASGAPVRQSRRGPAPIASFDHDGSDESSPETKQSFRLPEIVEDSSSASGGDALAPPEQRARSHSTPAAGALAAPPAPRIDISRASSSSHQDSRDSSPELALFAGAAPAAGEGLGFREDGALDLRSSTEELAFLEPAPGERAPPPAPAPPSRRHSRKDSQGSEAALLAVSGRTSRLSSVGSQCSAHSALSGFSRTSRVSRLSVASGASRSPSPHRMLLETSFCGPKPIETDPEVCAAAVEESLLEMAKLSTTPAPTTVTVTVTVAPVAPVSVVAAVVSAPVDARDRREVRTEATVERPAPRPASARPAPVPAAAPAPAPAPLPAPVTPAPALDEDKRQKETKNRVRAEERRARSRERRDDGGESRTKSRSKDIIRIRLKPSEEYDDDDDDEVTECAAPRPAAPEPSVVRAARPTELEATPRRPARDSRTPSPAGVVVSRKSSFCSLFKSRETIASPESPSEALRRKKSLNEGRSRSRSRDRSATPTSATKIKGSVLSLFKTPRKSATSPSPSSREGSPVVQPQRPAPPPARSVVPRGEKLKYYDDSKDGIIHIPLRTPPDEAGGPSREPDARPASAPQQRGPSAVTSYTGVITTASMSAHAARSPSKPIQRTVLPDGSIIIPLRSPTEKHVDDDPLVAAVCAAAPARTKTPEESRPTERTSRSSSTVEVVSAVVSPGPVSVSSEPASASPGDLATGPSCPDITPSPDPLPEAAPAERARSRRGRLIFTTHVGSAEQVFCTQFSITKTPSVTSEISGSFPSFPDVEEPFQTVPTPTPAPQTAKTSTPASERPAPPAVLARVGSGGEPVPSSSGASPQEAARDSSESEASSETAPPRGGNDVERRGLVVQESFEDELPYVPTTLPQERSLALPMVPVRDRGDVRVTAVERPRATAPRPAPCPRTPRVPPVPQVPPVPPKTPAPRVATTEEKIRIKLPRRPRTASASAAPPRPERTRARSGSDGMETRPKAEWIDFEEVPERRKQPKRIQTLPSAAVAGAAPARDVVFSYVEPEECRCECHARADDETPLLLDETDPRVSTSPVEGAAGVEAPQVARPFTGDLELHHDSATAQEGSSARQ